MKPLDAMLALTSGFCFAWASYLFETGQWVLAWIGFLLGVIGFVVAVTSPAKAEDANDDVP